MRKLAIIGASGHGRVVADIARKNGYSEIVFLDDDENIHECGGYPVTGKSAEAGMIDADVIVGIGNATVVMAGTVINPGARIGKGCIINTCSCVDHDCEVGDYVHIAVGSHLCGTVSVGNGTWIGAGATVSNNVSICSNCMIGAGSIVVKNIDLAGTYFGVPARSII